MALGGSAKPTVEKLRTLRALGAEVAYLALDADPAGEAATAVACGCAWEAGVDVAILSMPEDCQDPDEVLTRHGPSEGAPRLFKLEHADPGAAWLARSQLAQCPPVTFETAARLRVLSAETARLMPASSRPGYAVPLAQALGLSVGALMEEWLRHAAEVRAGIVRERLRRWASEWGGRLDRGSLSEHLDEATRVLAAARTDLSEPEMADVGVTDSAARVLSAPTLAHQSPASPALGV